MAPSADDWSLRYSSGNIPWDMRRPDPELSRRLVLDPSLGLPRVGRVLVPGCGLGHDALALAEAGWEIVAVDFASAVAPGVRKRIEAVGGTFLHDDALTLGERKFDVVFDHTFFCAVDPSARPQFGSMVGRVLRIGGSLVSIVFPVGREPGDSGPPHPMEVGDVTDVLGPGFRLAEQSEPFRTGRRAWSHVWARWDRVG